MVGNSKEIEVKLLIKNPEQAGRLLLNLGLLKVDTCIEDDYYFNHPCRNFAESDEALRLRSRNCGSSRTHVLTYKGPREIALSRVKVREELEVYLDERGFTEIKAILSRLGFKQVTCFTKKREIYSGRGVKASIDLLYGVGYFLELELEPHADEAYFKQLVDEVLRGLEATIVEKTYLEVCIETGKCVKS